MRNRPQAYLQDKPNEVELEVADCPNGCENGEKFLFAAEDCINYLPGKYCVVECKVCGLMRTNPRPTPGTIGFYYPNDYGPYLGTGLRKNIGRLDFIRSFIKKIIDLRAQTIPFLPPGKMLEVGCASGDYLAKMSSLGWIVRGVEFSSAAAECAKSSGFDVIIGAIEAVNLPSEEYDLITAWMVLEHLHKPKLALKKLHAAAKPGAVLAISIPNCARSFWSFQSDWFPLHVPNHLYHFNEETASKLLHSAGWRVYRCMHQRVAIDWALSALLRAQSRGYARPVAKKLIKILSGRMGLVFNITFFPIALVLATFRRGTRMTLWASRAEEAE